MPPGSFLSSLSRIYPAACPCANNGCGIWLRAISLARPERGSKAIACVCVGRQADFREAGISPRRGIYGSNCPIAVVGYFDRAWELSDLVALLEASEWESERAA